MSGGDQFVLEVMYEPTSMKPNSTAQGSAAFAELLGDNADKMHGANVNSAARAAAQKR